MNQEELPVDLEIVRAAIKTEMKVATEVSGPFERHWSAEGRKVQDTDGQYEVAQAKNAKTAQFIAQRDPASVIRQCEADLGLVDILSDASLEVSPDLLERIHRSLQAHYLAPARV